MDWQTLRHRLGKLLLLKLRFALSGLVATVIDYTLYLALVDRVLPPVASNIISYSCSVVVNFTLQRRFVFSLEGTATRAFLLSMLVSAGGLLLSTGIVYGLSQATFFGGRQYLIKLVATGIVFFYNFYLKRYVFERRFIDL